jgi:hypothetical protein
MDTSLFRRCVRKSSLLCLPEKTGGESYSPADVGDAALDRRGPRSLPKATGALH